MASSNSIHNSDPFASARCIDMPGNMSAMVIPSSGMVSATLIQNRRVISRSSGLSSSIEVTVRGSSAIPQIGQLPGSARMISGCMGHVYSVFVSEAGVSGSRAIPHLGHGPGRDCETSGHMGQTYLLVSDWGTEEAGVTVAAGFTPPSVTSAGPLGFRYSSGFA